MNEIYIHHNYDVGTLDDRTKVQEMEEYRQHVQGQLDREIREGKKIKREKDQVMEKAQTYQRQLAILEKQVNIKYFPLRPQGQSL